jgi:hypothetical protein
MKMRRTTFALISAFALLSSVAFGGVWQDQRLRSGTISVQPDGTGGISRIMVTEQREGTVAFVSDEMTFDGKTVKGVPFSAQTVSEHIQVLADGNRIVNTTNGAMYRDSEGRMRTERQISALGAFPAENEPTKMISINDPVAGVNFTLNEKNKTAVKRGTFKLKVVERPDPSGPEGGGRVTATREPNGDLRVERFGPPGPGPGSGSDIKTESLGQQMIEGVQAVGTRTTRTIPAGTIGNEQPIVVVSERWYSPELQTIIVNKHSDPRFGETTFRMVNIDRSEPSAALFQIPSDYNVVDGRPGPRLREEMKTRRRQPNEQ